jgi:hypothetical protein
VQPRRNKQAAKKFFRRLLKGLQYVPRVIITDQLRSYEILAFAADDRCMQPWALGRSQPLGPVSVERESLIGERLYAGCENPRSNDGHEFLVVPLWADSDAIDGDLE